MLNRLRRLFATAPRPVGFVVSYIAKHAQGAALNDTVPTASEALNLMREKLAEGCHVTVRDARTGQPVSPADLTRRAGQA
jgi:hypothetical protein